MTRRSHIIIALTLLTLFAASLRFFRLSNQSFWTDEVASIETARTPLNQIVDRSAHENNSLPTYFLLLRSIVGPSGHRIEFRARATSALAGSLSVPVFVLVVYGWRRNWRVALVAGLLLAVNPLHLWYSQEVRAYAVMLLFGLIALLANGQGNGFCRCIAGGRRPALWHSLSCALLYLFASILAMALHKTGLVFPFACGLWQGWKVLRRQAPIKSLSVHSVMLTCAIMLLSFKSYPPTKEFGRTGSMLELGYTAMTFIGGYSFGPSLTEIQTFGPWRSVTRHPTQVAILVILIFLFAVLYFRDCRRTLFSKGSGLLLIGVGIPLLGSLFTAFPYNVRYVLPALFGFIGIIAAFEDRAPETAENETERAAPRSSSLLVARRALLYAIVIVSLWADAQWYFSPAYRKGDSRAVASWLTAHRQEVKSWTVLPDYLAISVQWYLHDDPELLKRFQPPKESQTTSFPPVPDALILGRRHHLVNPDQIVSSYRAAAGNVEAINHFTGFDIYARTADR